MKKTLLMILSTVMFCLIIVGCSGAKDGAATDNSKDKKQFVIAGEKVELKDVELVPDRLEIAIPSTFNKMSEDMKKMKYPNPNPPSLVYTNAQGSTNIAFSQMQAAVKDEQIVQFKDGLKRSIKTNAKEWYNDGVTKINGKNIAYLEFLSEAANEKIYNHMMLMELDNKLVIMSFNCLEKDKQDWKPVVKEIMNSLKSK
jgi:hypothetical protein